MSAPLIAVLVAVIGLPLVIWWLLVLVEVVKIPGDEWDAAGQSQIVHVLLMVFLGLVGTIIYVTVGRPRLRASVIGS